MVEREREIKNAARREHVAQQGRKAKSKAKLSRRMAIKKAEREDKSGELKRQRLAANVPRTIENTREWVGSSRGDSHRDVDARVSEDEEDEEAIKKKARLADDDREQQGGDPRTRPVQIKQGTGEGQDGQDFQLDMAGLEDLFPEDRQPHASTSQLPPPHKPILLTTSPRPHGPTYAFLKEFQSLLGGEKYAQFVPRKNARFELSKVCKWAAKRGFGAIVVVGEDFHGEPATMTISLLPEGPCAHFRLTSVQLHRQISNSANPTSHVPELVLSNFSTPLGLSTGRLLQSMFPPLPQIVGRQVVAIHNQRDFVFFRRFRYMFALRETEASRQAAKAQGRDEDLRTRMQEIGPRFTLKLRWLKRGALGTDRRKGGTGTTKDVLLEGQQPDSAVPDEGFDSFDNHGYMDGIDAEPSTERDAEDEALARQEMIDQMGDSDLMPGRNDSKFVVGEDAIDGEAPADRGQSGAQMQTDAAPDEPKLSEAEQQAKRIANNKRKRRTRSPGGTIHIPEIAVPDEIPREELPHQRKLKKGASILDSLSMTVGHGRGGTKKAAKEWEWDPRMQVSRRRFFL